MQACRRTLSDATGRSHFGPFQIFVPASCPSYSSLPAADVMNSHTNPLGGGVQAASGRLSALGSSDGEGEGGVGSTEEASWGENARPVHSAGQSEPDSGPSAPNRVSTHRSPPHRRPFQHFHRRPARTPVGFDNQRYQDCVKSLPPPGAAHLTRHACEHLLNAISRPIMQTSSR